MKVVYLPAGAAGMYCGSCMHDNALAAAMLRMGCDIQLVPLYTPIRTDSESVAMDRVFYGAIHIYLLQKLPFLSKLPGFLTNWTGSLPIKPKHVLKPPCRFISCCKTFFTLSSSTVYLNTTISGRW